MGKNLTTGSVFRTIVTFALPYLLSYFLQTLYGMADLFIAGQFIGIDGITAVANGSQVLYMLTVVIVGLAMGATVTIGRAVGANRLDRAAKAIGNVITLFAGIALALTVVLLLNVHNIISLIGVPVEAVEGTAQYLTICYIGIPFIVAYNIISSVFRGMGDSKSPMYFIAVACFCNIVFDYLFMGWLRLGPSGAALGTTLAQAISVTVTLVAIRRRRTGIRLKFGDLRPDRAMLRGILGIGVPTAVQDGCIQIAFIIITVIANYRGLNDAAAVGVVEKAGADGGQQSRRRLGAEHRCRQDGASDEDTAIRHRDHRRLRHRHIDCGGTDGGLHRRPVHHRCDGNPAGNTVHPQLHRRQHLRGHPLLLQRLLRRMRALLYRIHPQYRGHHPGPCARGVSGIQAVPEHLVPHGRRRARRIAAFRADLSWLLRVAQASRRNFGEGACMTASERSGGRDALPGDGRLFRIGKVADMFNVSLGTLRHYERCGLLEPEYIDPRTGYRYYGAKQFEVLNTIRYLRVLDMPLTQIAEFLHNRDVHVIEDKLVAQKALIERKQHELEMVQRKIDHRLERLRDAEQSEFDVIRVVRQPACRIVWIRDSPKVDSYLGLEYSIRKLEQHQKDSLVFLGKVGVGIDKESLEQGGYADYGLVFLLLDDEDEYEGDTVALPETDCVRIRFRGSHGDAPDRYRELIWYTAEQGLDITGFSREIALIDEGLTSDPAQFVTEICIPVR
mgnify:CR=1 FL=1